MKIIILGDTHFGARGNAKVFHDSFRKFYTHVLFPYMEKNDIDHIIQVGDMFDNRKQIDLNSLTEARDYFFNPAKKKGFKIFTIIGNHDAYYKNHIKVNSPSQLLEGYDNITIFQEPTEYTFDHLNILMVPWICSDNHDRVMDLVESTRAQIMVGHLELSGFQMHKGSIVSKGMNHEAFRKFDMVITGHYHHRSSRDNINYVGTPYELTWADYNDPKGFHIFDTDTRELTFVENSFNMFHKVDYNDHDKSDSYVTDHDFEKYQGSYVKLLVHSKTNEILYENFKQNILESAFDLQVLEDSLAIDMDQFDEVVKDAEDTISILKKVVMESEFEHREELSTFLTELYHEAQNQ